MGGDDGGTDRSKLQLGEIESLTSGPRVQVVSRMSYTVTAPRSYAGVVLMYSTVESASVISAQASVPCFALPPAPRPRASFVLMHDRGSEHPMVRLPCSVEVYKHPQVVIRTSEKYLAILVLVVQGVVTDRAIHSYLVHHEARRSITSRSL